MLKGCAVLLSLQMLPEGPLAPPLLDTIINIICLHYSYTKYKVEYSCSETGKLSVWYIPGEVFTCSPSPPDTVLSSDLTIPDCFVIVQANDIYN